jgi:hypothetical protein
MTNLPLITIYMLVIYKIQYEYLMTSPQNSDAILMLDDECMGKC